MNESVDSIANDVVDFLATIRPFDELPFVERLAIARRLTRRVAPRGEIIVAIGEKDDRLFLLRDGAVDVHDASDALHARRHERESFGFASLVQSKPASHRVTAYEDALFYELPSADFHRLCERYDAFHDYYLLAEAQRLHLTLERERQHAVPWGSSSITALCDHPSRAPLIARSQLSITAAAKLMSEHDESSLLFVNAAGSLTGIVTDRDLRGRVLACGVSADMPIEPFMSRDAVSIDVEQSVFDASLQMMRHNVHHLPIVRQGRPVGLITSADVWQLVHRSPLHVSTEVLQANTIEQLATIGSALPDLFCQLVDSGLEAHQVAHYISSIGENITSRLLQLAELQLGLPPVDYAWVAAGSLGRREQLLHSDQDNAMLLSDEYEEAVHGEYFSSLSAYVCDALDRCHYVRCPGDIMASNPRWRQPLRQWKQYFDQWIARPRAQELVHCSIFFDLRALHGNTALLTELQESYATLAAKSPRFLAHLFVNTLQHTPPLGFFRRLVLLNDEEHRDRLNLKNRGTGPVVDLARSLAIAAGITANNTRNRIIQVANTAHLDDDDAGSLGDAYELISRVRLRHQARQIRSGKAADNFIDPDDLTSFERDHLRDAFRVVAKLQESLVRRYRLYLS